MDRAIQFFEDFVSDFKSFDGKLIATHYFAPYTAVDSAGNITLYEDVSDIVALFQGYLNDYHNQGSRSCRYCGLEVVDLGKNCICATVTWEMLDQSGQLVLSWHESYNILYAVFSSPKVFTSIDH